MSVSARVPVIDVLIPTFNAAGTLVSAIDSICAQSFQDMRIIVVDDGSDDDSAALLTEIAEREPRLEILRKPNSGIVDSLNLALAASTGEFVARHDSDDLADPTRLQVQLDYLRQHQDVVAVSSFARHIDHHGRELGTIARFGSPDQANADHIPSREPYLLHPFLLARRRALLQVGGYRFAHHAEDTDLYWRLQEIGRLHVIPEVLGAYRFNHQSITSRSAHNGRVSAIFSQLAALSAKRRRRGDPDLEFTKAFAEDVSFPGPVEDMLQVASGKLSKDEREYLRVAVAAKILELTSYKPYEMDLADCEFIASTLRAATLAISSANLQSINRLRAIAVARLLRKGAVRRARMLVTARAVPQAFWRLCIETTTRLLPTGTRAGVNRLRNVLR